MSSPSRPIPRVVVTGMGAVTPAGPTAAATYARVSEGRGCTGTDLTAPVTDFDPSTVLDPREARRVDRVGQFGLVAAAEALGGKGGGGRPDMAQAGGPDASKSAEAIAAVEALLADGAA